MPLMCDTSGSTVYFQHSSPSIGLILQNMPSSTYHNWLTAMVWKYTCSL